MTGGRYDINEREHGRREAIRGMAHLFRRYESEAQRVFGMSVEEVLRVHKFAGLLKLKPPCFGASYDPIGFACCRCEWGERCRTYEGNNECEVPF